MSGEMIAVLAVGVSLAALMLEARLAAVERGQARTQRLIEGQLGHLADTGETARASGG